MANLIKSSGYFNQKAERLKIIAEFLSKNPIKKLKKLSTEELRKTLLSVKGIGPETADSIILYAFKKPIFVIDAYTKRIFIRTGLAKEKVSYEELQALFHRNLRKDLKIYNEYHALLVEHAKNNCKKRPECKNCCIKKTCKTGYVHVYKK